MWKRRLPFLALLLFFASCSQNDTTFSRTDLHINFQDGDLPSLHPHEISETPRGLSIAKTLFEGLTRIDSAGKVQLAGANRVELSPDGLHYLFHLRNNRWSNGSAVTAFQYEATWKEALSPHSNPSRAEPLFLLKNGAEAKQQLVPPDIVGVQALDDYILSVTLAAPNSDFLRLLALPIFYPLLHPESKTQTEFNGPFLVALWDKGQHLCLKANPYFWNRENVFLRQIDITMVPDPLALYEQQTTDSADDSITPLTELKDYALDPSGAIDFSYASF